MAPWNFSILPLLPLLPPKNDLRNALIWINNSNFIYIYWGPNIQRTSSCWASCKKCFVVVVFFKSMYVPIAAFFIYVNVHVDASKTFLTKKIWAGLIAGKNTRGKGDIRNLYALDFSRWSFFKSKLHFCNLAVNTRPHTKFRGQAQQYNWTTFVFCNHDILCF